MPQASKPVRIAVFPVAGMGTRFLPATKAVPKEMLPVVDKPVIQYAVEEAREAGIEQFVFITGRGKPAPERSRGTVHDKAGQLLRPRSPAGPASRIGQSWWTAGATGRLAAGGRSRCRLEPCAEGGGWRLGGFIATYCSGGPAGQGTLLPAQGHSSGWAAIVRHPDGQGAGLHSGTGLSLP